MTDNFYRAFEDRYRGDRDLIKDRLRMYLPFVRPLLDVANTHGAVDLGCGRGEWVELLAEEGFSAQGVDLDEGMLAACRERSLNVEQGDAMDYLKCLEADSQAVVSGFHVAEHIPFEYLRGLVAEAFRVLEPAGLLILETPNPENLVVGASSFYLDPTHERPLPPDLLLFLADYQGFQRTKVLRLNQPEQSDETLYDDLSMVFKGVSPDYAVVAQKTADGSVLCAFDRAFEVDYGATLDARVAQYEANLTNKLEQIQSEMRHEQEVIRQQNEEAHASTEPLWWCVAAEREHRGRLESELTEERERRARLESEKQGAEHENAELRELVQQVRNELNAAQEKVEHSQHDAHHWWALSNELKHELESVYTSKSWRMTWPLRKAMLFAKWLSRQPKRIVIAAVRAPLRLGHTALVRAMKVVLDRPSARARILRWLDHHPDLKVRLCRKYEDWTLEPRKKDEDKPPVCLSDDAARIFTELKRTTNTKDY